MTRQILFDATRLVSRTERAAPTGIDRVCLAYAEWLMSLPHARMTPVRARKGRLLELDPVWFRGVVQGLRIRWGGYVQSGGGDDLKLAEALAAPAGLRRTLRRAPPAPEAASKPSFHTLPRLFNSRYLRRCEPGALYINVGHTGLEEPSILASLRKSGASCVVFLHDIIPMTNPEYCRPGDDGRHHRRVTTVLDHAASIIVNSRATADALARHALAEGRDTPSTVVAHLGIEKVFSELPPPSEAQPVFFLHVGTIEARKNLAFLLTIWARLAETMGESAPQLVLVGRYGWENEAVLDHLERSPSLQSLVHHVSDLSDTALAALMTQARAVLAPSSAEGFDLPAVEARAIGAPLIASDIPAHQELTPDAVFLDPLDGLGWLATIRDAALGPPPPRTRVAPPTWDEHFATVGRHLGLTSEAKALPLANQGRHPPA